MTSKRAVAVIGLGMASAPHAKSLQDLQDRLNVKAVFSPSEERRSEFSNKYGFPAADSLESILQDNEISAVLLLTPPNARQELVSRLCEHGKHILMEKPLERTTEAAMLIEQQCRLAGISTGVVFQNRFRDGAIRLAQRIKDGALGEVHSAQVSVPWWRGQSYYDEPLRGSYERDGGGVLISQAIHTLDLVQSLLGPVSEVAAISGTTAAHNMESEDFVGAGIRFSSGALGSLHASTAQYPGGLESISLSGTLGSATLLGGELRITYRDGSTEAVGEASTGGGTADPMAFSHEWHKRLIAEFFESLDANRSPAVSLEQALCSHRLIDALRKSSHQGTHVRIE